jgi:DNA-binding transcriptional MerR regulator
MGTEVYVQSNRHEPVQEQFRPNRDPTGDHGRLSQALDSDVTSGEILRCEDSVSATSSAYRVGDFAQLAGVTIRTLHHYDRVGLLRPKRSRSGYRVYTVHDLERLEQIVVLRFMGVPLRRIAELLRASPRSLVVHLRAQRGTLEKKQRLLQRAIAAITDLETAITAGQATTPAMFKRIIEVVNMENSREAMKQEYDDLVARKTERLRGMSPMALAELRSQWSLLTKEIAEALDEDPASSKAQALGGRWLAMLARLMGQPVEPEALGTHRQDWTPQMASWVEKPVWDFMTRVLDARR